MRKNSYYRTLPDGSVILATHEQLLARGFSFERNEFGDVYQHPYWQAKNEPAPKKRRTFWQWLLTRPG